MKRWHFWLVAATCLGCGLLAGLILALDAFPGVGGPCCGNEDSPSSNPAVRAA